MHNAYNNKYRTLLNFISCYIAHIIILIQLELLIPLNTKNIIIRYSTKPFFIYVYIICTSDTEVEAVVLIYNISLLFIIITMFFFKLNPYFKKKICYIEAYIK